MDTMNHSISIWRLSTTQTVLRIVARTLGSAEWATVRALPQFWWMSFRLMCTVVRVLASCLMRKMSMLVGWHLLTRNLLMTSESEARSSTGPKQLRMTSDSLNIITITLRRSLGTSTLASQTPKFIFIPDTRLTHFVLCIVITKGIVAGLLKLTLWSTQLIRPQV